MADTFEILNVAPRKLADAVGGLVDVQRVTFSTKPSGLIGVAEIPAAAFTPDEVAKVVGTQAALLETVKNL